MILYNVEQRPEILGIPVRGNDRGARHGGQDDQHEQPQFEGTGARLLLMIIAKNEPGHDAVSSAKSMLFMIDKNSLKCKRYRSKYHKKVLLFMINYYVNEQQFWFIQHRLGA